MLEFLALVFFIYSIGRGWVLYQARRLPSLSQPNTATHIGPWPKISIVIPARNEARTIGNAIKSLIAIDYPDFELLVVNDRSSDETGAILKKVQDQFPPLRVFEVQSLPEGWIGKNHAMHIAARGAQGDLVLFTDADVVFEQDALKKAVVFFEQHRLDHLALLLKTWSRSYWVDAFIPFFGLSFLLYMRPWLAKSSEHPTRHVGIGGFNLVRKSALEQIDYFARIPLRPDDDVKLGKLLKMEGFKQDCAVASREVSVEWYSNFKDCMRGLEKNLFSGTDYRLSHALGGAFIVAFLALLPWYLLLVARGWIFWGVLATQLLELYMMYRSARMMGTSLDRLLVYPLSALVFSFFLLRTTVKNLLDGGIYWRDTFYPLEQLRKNSV